MANSAKLFLGFLVMSIFLLPKIAIGKSNGFTLKLIHRDSPESPLYQANLAQLQRTRKLILQSLARSTYQSHEHPSNSTQHFINVLRSKVDYQLGSIFMAQVGIGSFRASWPNSSSPISYFLHVDTGSSLIWTQCEECKARGNNCFYQKQPIFPDLRSSSYTKLPCNVHPLCYPRRCVKRFCSYHYEYEDGSSSEGYLASETFSFDSSTSIQKEIVQNMVFGCGFNQQNMKNYGDQGNIAGILGLGWGPRSLVKQLGSRAGGRFSYCLQRVDGNHQRNTFLRFGSDIPSRSGLQTTDLLQYGSEEAYFVNLVDISIAGSRLHIPSDHFIRRGSRGGTIFDSGTSYTIIIESAYNILEQALVNHFSKFVGLTRIRVPRFFSLCYKRSIGRGFSNLPNITFHIGDANLVAQPEVAFSVDKAQDGKEFFCLAMASHSLFQSNMDDPVTAIGAYQQINHRIIYDVTRKKLQFRPEDCTQNP
ncbi:Aspartic peptidase [Trema orientale]|uniref:Aspartic peptidase n=1 Tax=Trema orientale TaxID=63057 RepID=A0A2P5EGG8_TREOI|nr:Aspartic peptidase [Trema orientale]